MACEARRELDEMVCRCGKRWDAKDPAPPVCQHDRPTTNFIFNSGNPDPFPSLRNDRRYYVVHGAPHKPHKPSPIAALIPQVLPDGTAREMAHAFQALVYDGANPTEAMRGAWRVFLKTLPGQE